MARMIQPPDSAPPCCHLSGRSSWAVHDTSRVSRVNAIEFEGVIRELWILPLSDRDRSVIVNTDICHVDCIVGGLEGVGHGGRIAVDSHFHVKFASLVKLCQIEIRFCLDSSSVGVDESSLIRDLHDDRVIRIILVDKFQLPARVIVAKNRRTASSDDEHPEKDTQDDVSISVTHMVFYSLSPEKSSERSHSSFTLLEYRKTTVVRLMHYNHQPGSSGVVREGSDADEPRARIGQWLVFSLQEG